MHSKHLRLLGMVLIILALGSVLLAACARPGTATGGGNSGGTTPTSSSGNCASGTVHTLATSFQESCVNVAKGSKLTITPSAASFHNFSSGSWVNGNQQPATEPGAPTVNNVQETSTAVTIGPFTTAGTFHIFCTVHPGMNLTINVK